MTKSPTREWVSSLIAQFSGQHNTLTIFRPFIKMTGSIEAALLLSQIIYWSDRSTMDNGWFAKTYHEWEDELTLTKHQVMSAVKKLKGAGIKTELKKYKGAPTVHYRFDCEEFSQWIVKFFNNPLSNNLTNDSEKTSQSSTYTTAKTTAYTKKRVKKSFGVVKKTVVRLPDNIWTWQQAHVVEYYKDHADDLDALASSFDKMYIHFTEMTLVDERGGIETYKELCRQGVACSEYVAIINHTRKARTWQDRVRIGDVMKEISSYKEKFKRSNIINIDPAMDLNKPVDIVPILMQKTEEAS
jgi:hypothetical protein